MYYIFAIRQTTVAVGAFIIEFGSNYLAIILGEHLIALTIENALTEAAVGCCKADFSQ